MDENTNQEPNGTDAVERHDSSGEQSAEVRETSAVQPGPPDEAAEQIDQTSDVTEESAVSEMSEEERECKTEPTVIYRWEYAEQAAADAKAVSKNRRTGVVTFAAVMTACFVLTLLVLIASLAGGFDLSASDWSDDGHLERGDDDAETLTLQQISANGNQVVVAVSVKTVLGGGVGSGIIMTEDGYIATNYHVIDGATDITVLLYDGTEYTATVIGSSEIDDLAVIKIDAKRLPVATFGDSSHVLVGDRAVVIGHPAGLEFGWTSTYGYISAINRDVKIRDYDGTMTKRMTVLQTDADVNSGNSGGPMFNSRGEVIGIITMKLAGDYEGMGFAIPSNGAVPLLEALIKTGTTDGVKSEVSTARPVLGITGVSVVKDQYYKLESDRIVTLPEESAFETEGSFKADATGVLITAVTTASDAYDKLLEGDIITAMDGKTMSNMSEMREYLYDLNVGDTVEITYVREGESAMASVRLMAAEE